MKLNGDFPTVLFSIEIGTRELDSKLVMASAIAGKGLPGGRRPQGDHQGGRPLPRTGVVWQGKSLFPAKDANHVADQLIGKRSAIMFIHDEGGMHQVKAWPNHVLKTHRVEISRKRNINRVCVWGERQKEVLSDYAAELKDVIRVTGSPKFDLCLPDYAWVTKQRRARKPK